MRKTSKHWALHKGDSGSTRSTTLSTASLPGSSILRETTRPRFSITSTTSRSFTSIRSLRG